MALTLCAMERPAVGSDVEIHLELFGACNAFRGGDVTGIRVRLQSALPEPTTAIVQWDLENADGDVASHWREVTLPPGQPVSRWLYAKLPPISARALSTRVFSVSVYQSRDSRRVRPLGSLRFTPTQADDPSIALEKNQDAIAIVGDGRMGLEELNASANGFSFVPSMNSCTRIPRGVSPEDVPDRWEGLWSFNELVWSRDSPQALTGDRARALRDWIERGGSLVIVLPEKGNPWSMDGGARHFLSDLLPSSGVRQVDGVPVESLLPALSRAGDLRRDDVRTPIHVFDTQNLSEPWRGLIALPNSNTRPANQIQPSQGRQCIVARRAFGHGAITLVGVDIDALHRGSYTNEPLPDVDTFWNRILGRRADSMSANDFDRLQKHVPKKLAPSTSYDEYDCGDGELVLDVIGLRGKVVAGVLATFGLFLVYWLAACPIAWMALGKKKLRSLSWLVFAGVSLLACAASYGLSGLARTTSTQLRHLTVLDSIEDPSTASIPRASAWISALLPGFKSAGVSLQSDGSSRDCLTSWAPPDADGSRRFPDSARYDQPIDDPSTSQLPSRATTSDFEIRWMGDVPRSWGALPSQVIDKKLRATAKRGEMSRVFLAGSIAHQLPGPLKNVILIHVSPFQFATQQWRDAERLSLWPSAPLANAGRMVSLTQDWMPGQELDVAKALYPDGEVDPAKLDAGSLTQAIRDTYTRPLRQLSSRMVPGQGPEVFAGNRVGTHLQMLSLYQMLQPPAYEMNPPDAPAPVRVTRELGRGLDLSRWLTQPCLIVLGTLEDAAIPIPMKVAGEGARGEGHVFVRHIIPLPDDEAIYWPALAVP